MTLPEHLLFVDVAGSARAFMDAVLTLPHPPRAKEQLCSCERSFRASFLQALSRLRESDRDGALSGFALFLRRRLPPEVSARIIELAA